MAAAFDSGAFESTAFELTSDGGGGGVTGSLAKTLGAALAASVGTIDVQGTSSKALGVVNLAAVGGVATQGTLSTTLGTATLSAASSVDGIAGSLSATLGNASVAAAGTVSTAAALTQTLGATALASTGGLAVVGTLTQMLGAASVIAFDGEPVPVVVGGGGGVSGGSLRDIRAYADLLDKARPTKAAKKRRRKELVAAALELLPDEPAAIAVAEVIAKAIVRKETAVIERWTPPRALMPVSEPAPAFDPAEALRQMVEEWLADEAMRRELEDEEEIEMLLLG